MQTATESTTRRMTISAITRGRPYKKDDNAHVEQKNWTHVRKLLGWERYDSRAVVEAIRISVGFERRRCCNARLTEVSSSTDDST